MRDAALVKAILVRHKERTRVAPGELHTRDWAKWHMEHPYVKHPRRKHFTETEHHAHRPSGLPERSIIRNAENVKPGDRLSGYSSPVDTVETSQYGMVKIKLRDGSSFQRRQGAQVSVFPGAEPSTELPQPPEPPKPPEPTKPDTGNPHAPGSEEHAEYERGYERALNETQNYAGRSMTSHEAQAHANGAKERELNYAAEALAKDRENGTGRVYRLSAAHQQGQARAYSDHAATAAKAAAEVSTENPYPPTDPLHDEFQGAYEVMAKGLKGRTYTPTAAREQAEQMHKKAEKQEILGTAGRTTGPQLAAQSLGKAKALSEYADYYQAELDQTPVTAAHHETAVRMAMDMADARGSFHETRMQRALDQVRNGTTRASVAEAATDDAVNKFWQYSVNAKPEAAQALTAAVAKLKPGELLDAPTVYDGLRNALPSDIRLATDDINKALKTYDRNANLADDARQVDAWLGEIASSVAHGTPMPGTLKFGRRRYKVTGHGGGAPVAGYSAEHAELIRKYLAMDNAMEDPDKGIRDLEGVSLRDIAIEQKAREKGEQIVARIDANPSVAQARHDFEESDLRFKTLAAGGTAKPTKKAEELQVGDYLDGYSRKGLITKIEQTTDTNYLGHTVPAYNVTYQHSMADGTTKEKTDKIIEGITSPVSTPESEALDQATVDRKAALQRYKDQLRFITLAELTRERPISGMGGVVNDQVITSRKPNDPRIEKLRTALSVYPSDWVQRSADAGRLELGRSIRRANYSLGTINISPGDSNATYVHELGHHMQRTIDKLSEAEHVQLLRRAGRERLKGMRSLKPGYGYGSHEKARADEFVDPYVGKSYGERAGSPHEVFTVGVQSLLGKDGSVFGRLVGLDGKDADPELRAFILGVLADLGAPDVPRPLAGSVAG